MPKFKVTVEMTEISTCEIEVEASDEEAAENKAVRVAEKDYKGAQALPWETLVGETEMFADEVTEIKGDKNPGKKSKKAVKTRGKKVLAQVIQFPGTTSIVKASP